MSKLLILFLSVLSVCHSWPSSKYGYKKDLARTEEGDPLPDGAQIPDNGTFLEKYQTFNNGIIQGQYSYFDPMGSLVVVKYTMDKDGKNYSEKRLVTVHYDNIDQTEATSVSEDELVDRVIEKLRPQIIELVKGKDSGISNSISSDVLTPMSQSAFGYLSSKFNKFENILSQIMCDLMTSNIDPKNTKTEDELISSIIFKIFTLLPEGTLLTYAKKLSRHVRYTVDSTTTIPELDETTTLKSDEDEEEPFNNFISSFILKLFAANNETNISIGNSFNATSDYSDLFDDTDSDLDSESGGFISELFKNVLEMGLGAAAEEENPVAGYLKQILFSGTTSHYSNFLELFYDAEALFKIYMREATCSSIPERKSSVVKEKSTIQQKNDEEKLEGLATLIKTKVSKHILKMSDISPLEDEKMIEDILDEVSKAERLEDLKRVRSQIIEEIHDRRLDMYKQKSLSDWPQKTTS